MKRYRCLIAAGTAGLLLLAGTFVHATTVYKTVDENGVVGFSDTPPAEARLVDTLQIEVIPPADPGAYAQRLAAMRETTDRMAEARRAREKHRAEMRRLAQEEEQAQPVYVRPVRHVHHTPAFLPHHRKFAHRKHGHRHPGEHAEFVTRRDIAGSGRILQPQNAQLMRPLVSRR